MPYNTLGEHDMAMLSALCDELVALENGEVIFRGPPSEVLAHPAVIRSYLGVDEATINRTGSGTGPRRQVRRRALVPATRRPMG